MGYPRGDATDHYRVAWEARARLVRGEPSEVIRDASCDHVASEPQGSRATWDDLEGNGAALLKQKLSEAALACVEQLTADPSGLDAAVQ